METYIAILRGINVSGKKKIKMDELRYHLLNINLKDIRTYIQSGNVVFKSQETDQHLLAKQIADKIEKEYSFNVPVIVLNINELINIAENNSFINDRGEDISKLHVTFLSEEPDKEKLKILDIINDEPNEFIAFGKAIYLFCPNGYGSIKLTNNFIESKLKVTATTRNWNTIISLIELASL